MGRTWIQAEFPTSYRAALEKRLLPLYHDLLIEHGIQNYSLDDCLFDYRLCLLANIPHALSWETFSYLESAMRAFQEWECDQLLD